MPGDTSSWRVPVMAGGAAGLVETTATYPLDLVKSLHQLKEGGRTGSVLSTLRGVVDREGVAGLYRGLLSPVVSEVPRRALKFGANGVYKQKAQDAGITGSAANILCGAGE